MLKEAVICIIIVVAIFSLDIFTQGYTKKTTQEITEILIGVKEELLKEDKTKIENKIKELDERWYEKHDKLAYYIEHDELEKVDTAIVAMKSYVETEDYFSAIEEIEEGKFILEHIQKKNAFNLENIF